MRSSRLGVIVLIALSVLITSNCSYYGRIMSRKNLVDGSTAYKERKFDQAEELFRKAAARDPEGETQEGRTAQLFLARTLHSEYIGNRQDKSKAEEAIAAYQKALSLDKNDQSSYKAVASLYENLQRQDDWLKWVTERANNTEIQPQYRAEALTSLAARKNSCASDISDTEQTKKTVKKDGKEAYQFIKPEDPAEFEKLKQCVAEGNQLIEQAIALEPDMVKNAKNLNPATMSDKELKDALSVIKPFESARSYHASLLIQAMRVAEMEGRTADQEALKKKADEAKEKFQSLSEVGRNIEREIETRQAAADQAANANANSK